MKHLAAILLLWVSLTGLVGESLPPAPPSALPTWDRSPMASFRKWLALPPKDRPAALADRSEERRNKLLDKLAEYDEMPAEERENKLRMLEFDWYMRSLLRISAAERAESLLTLPKEWEAPVKSRLRQWEQLPVDLQTELLSSELLTRIFIHGQRLSRQDEVAAFQQLPPDVRMRWEAQLQQWRGVTGTDRAKVAATVQPFFGLSAPEQQRALQAMNPSDRREMEATLEAFNRLPKEERDKCMEAFQNFAGMSNDERRQFLMNAGRWQAMSPRDRTVWRALMQALPPSMKGQNLPPFPPAVLPNSRRTASTNTP